jgi:uncharacterized protein YkwD
MAHSLPGSRPRVMHRASLVTAMLLLAGSSARAQQFTAQEKGIFNALNELRLRPPAFVRTLQTFRSYYHGNLFIPPGHTPIETREGVKPVDETMAVLRRLPHPLGRLTLSRGLSKAAALQVRDTGAKGLVGHAGSDGGPAERIDRFGRWSGSIGECISYGDADPTGVVAQLLVDDGVPDRGHRTTLLDGAWRYVGISCGAHAVYRGMCVIDFAVAFEER